MVCQILFGSLVGAVILGAAIALYNMLLGGKRANTRNSEALRSGQPLSLPGVNTAPATIPEPSFAKAMVIVTVLTLASLIGEAIAGHLLSLPVVLADEFWKGLNGDLAVSRNFAGYGRNLMGYLATFGIQLSESLGH
jgi:hypothetical protein